MTPEEIAQGQLDAYNSHDIETFSSYFAEDILVFDFPNELRCQGKADFINIYGPMFQKFDKLHAKLLNRMVIGDQVLDHEEVSGVPGKDLFYAIAIYKIKDNKISEVRFIK